MLFLNPEVGNPIRAQGVMITDMEIERLVSHWQKSVGVTSEAPPGRNCSPNQKKMRIRDLSNSRFPSFVKVSVLPLHSCRDAYALVTRVPLVCSINSRRWAWLDPHWAGERNATYYWVRRMTKNQTVINRRNSIQSFCCYHCQIRQTKDYQNKLLCGNIFQNRQLLKVSNQEILHGEERKQHVI